MRANWDDYFMQLAVMAANRATCPRLHVGAVLIDYNKRILGTGYNGAPSGEPHCDDVGCLMVGNSCKRTLHAERNALEAATRRERAGSTLYCTDVACIDCANAVVRSGVVEFVYMRPYKDLVERIRPLMDYHGVVMRQHELRLDDPRT